MGRHGGHPSKGPLEGDAPSAPNIPARECGHIVFDGKIPVSCIDAWVSGVAAKSPLWGAGADEDGGVPSGNFFSYLCHTMTVGLQELLFLRFFSRRFFGGGFFAFFAFFGALDLSTAGRGNRCHSTRRRVWCRKWRRKCRDFFCRSAARPTI